MKQTGQNYDEEFSQVASFIHYWWCDTLVLVTTDADGNASGSTSC